MEIIKVISDPTDEQGIKSSVCEYVIFVNFKKAYDFVHPQSLFNIPNEFNFPNKLIILFEVTLKNTEIVVKKSSEVSSPAIVSTDLRQGDALSPMLFNLILKKVV